MLANPLGEIGQLTKPGKTVDELLLIGPQAGAEQFTSIGSLKRQAGTGKGRQQWITDQLAVLQPGLDLRPIIGQLLQQDRGKIDHRPCLRVRLQMGRHIHIVLYAVQIDPRQLVVTMIRPPVVRLVHVPAQHHLQAIAFTGHGASPVPAYLRSPAPPHRG